MSVGAPPRLRVGFMAGALADGGGMARYVRELLRELGRRDDLEVVPVIPERAADVLAGLELRSALPALILPGRGQVTRSLWERYRLGAALERRGVAVIHGAKHLLPKTRLATVLTAHDVMPITWPQQFNFAKRLLLPAQYRASLREATRILSVSEATRTRLAALDPAFAAKAVVVPNGVSTGLLNIPPEPLPGLAGRKFALVVGDLSPRKNLSLLLDIWGEVYVRTAGLVLVAVGPDGWCSEGTRQRLRAVAERGEAVWASRVSEGQLRWGYEQAHMVLLPTLEEGFGLPVVEALALGAPVIASTDPALMEVGQGRPLHLDATDRAAWTRAIIAAAMVPRPAPPATPLVLPTWVAHAEQAVKLYHEAVASHARR